MEFKDIIRQLRMEKNMSQTQLAAILDRGDSAIRMWESGKSKPDMDTVLRLCEIFNCSIDYMFGKSIGKTFEIDDIIKRTGLDEESIRILSNYLLEKAFGLNGAVELRVINAIIKEKDLLNALVYYLYHRLDKGLFYVTFSEDLDSEKDCRVKSIPIKFYIEDSMNAEEDMQAMTFVKVDENNMKHFLKMALDNELEKLYEKIHKTGE